MARVRLVGWRLSCQGGDSDALRARRPAGGSEGMARHHRDVRVPGRRIYAGRFAGVWSLESGVESHHDYRLPFRLVDDNTPKIHLIGRFFLKPSESAEGSTWARRLCRSSWMRPHEKDTLFPWLGIGERAFSEGGHGFSILAARQGCRNGSCSIRSATIDIRGRPRPSVSRNLSAPSLQYGEVSAISITGGFPSERRAPCRHSPR